MNAFWTAAAEPVMGLIAVLLFVAFDIVLVVAALLWLSDRRSLHDITDARYRERRRRPR